MDGGRVDEVKRGILGSIDEFADNPLETINYIECHDNRTLYDHFKEYVENRCDDIAYSESDFERMSKLGAAIILTSQGVPFIQMGQEMLRTKGGVENSYNSPDSVNMVRWEWKEKRLAVVEYYKGLIALRKNHPLLFCMTDQGLIRDRITFYEHLDLPVPERCIAYWIRGYDDNLRYQGPISIHGKAEGQDYSEIENQDYSEIENQWRYVVVLLNPRPLGLDFALPGAFEERLWIPMVSDTFASGSKSVSSPVKIYAHVPGRSAMVLRAASPKEVHAYYNESSLEFVSDPFTVPLVGAKLVEETNMAVTLDFA